MAGTSCSATRGIEEWKGNAGCKIFVVEAESKIKGIVFEEGDQAQYHGV